MALNPTILKLQPAFQWLYCFINTSCVSQARFSRVSHSQSRTSLKASSITSLIKSSKSQLQQVPCFSPVAECKLVVQSWRPCSFILPFLFVKIMKACYSKSLLCCSHQRKESEDNCLLHKIAMQEIKFYIAVASALPKQEK